MLELGFYWSLVMSLFKDVRRKVSMRPFIRLWLKTVLVCLYITDTIEWITVYWLQFWNLVDVPINMPIILADKAYRTKAT